MNNTSENDSNNLTLPDTYELFSTFSDNDTDNIIIDTIANKKKSNEETNKTTKIINNIKNNNLNSSIYSNKINEDINNFYKACQSTVIVPINYTKLSFNQKKVVQDTIQNLLINLEILGEAEKKEKEEQKKREQLENDEIYSQQVIDDLNKKREIVSFLESILCDESIFFINSLVRRSENGFIKLVYLNQYLKEINLNVANSNDFNDNPDVLLIKKAVALMSTCLEFSPDGYSIRYNKNMVPFCKSLDNYSIEILSNNKNENEVDTKSNNNSTDNNLKDNNSNSTTNIPNIPTLNNNINNEDSNTNKSNTDNNSNGTSENLEDEKLTASLKNSKDNNDKKIIIESVVENIDDVDMEISDDDDIYNENNNEDQQNNDETIIVDSSKSNEKRKETVEIIDERDITLPVTNNSNEKEENLKKSNSLYNINNNNDNDDSQDDEITVTNDTQKNFSQ